MDVGSSSKYKKNSRITTLSYPKMANFCPGNHRIPEYFDDILLPGSLYYQTAGDCSGFCSQHGCPDHLLVHTLKKTVNILHVPHRFHYDHKQFIHLL